MRPRRWNIPKVAITHNSDEAAAIKQALELLQITSDIGNEDVVVITPNWVNNSQPGSAVVVGPESLRQIIRIFREKAPKRIVVATGTADGETKDVMDSVGFGKVIAEEGVEFIDLNHGPFTRIELEHPIVKATNLNRLYEEVTVLVSFTQLKQHEEATISAAIKNIALGWPPADEHGHPKKNLGIHTDLHGFIYAMAGKVPIDLSIVSASPAMIGTGPSKGISRHTGLVVAGCDPVAADTVAARLLGFKPQAVHYLFECGNNKIGESVIEKIIIEGIQLVEAENIFSQAAYGDGLAVDKK